MKFFVRMRTPLIDMSAYIMTVVTRFAPSPTGYLHVGGARTALFSWLYARKHSGKFILRIEDTDRERSTEASINAILEGMAWLGLNHDEGPYYQTHRFERYQSLIDQLLSVGQAYRCYCTKAELETLRESQMQQKLKPRYNGLCRNHNTPKEGVEPVIRFRNPDSGQVTFNDLVRGTVTFSNEELDDLIIARSDGTPTYNFTVVVDDMDMGITHAIRGDDHINNTPRQINIINALNGTPPQYAHVPMILGDDGQRLSKRHGAVSVLQYKEDGFLPEALLNYLVRLGWSHGDQELFTIDEMIQLFDIKDVNKAASAFNTEKLLWLNQQYLINSNNDHLANAFKAILKQKNIDPDNGPDIITLIDTQKQRAKTLLEMADISLFFYQDFDEFDKDAAKKHLRPVILVPFQSLYQSMEKLDHWTPEPIHQCIIDVAEKLGIKMGKIAQPLRVAVTGNSMSPSIDITVALVGKVRTLKRMQMAIKYMQQRQQP